MKSKDVKTGGTYTAKVSNQLVPVRIEREHTGGGWEATNLKTRKKVRIKTAGRLRGEHKTAEKAKAISEPKAAPAAPKRRGKVRIALAGKEDGKLQSATEKAATSVGHIAFGRNGQMHECYYRVHNGSPAVWKAPLASPVAESGYREQEATLIGTGVDAVRELVKRLTGKSPAAVGITLRPQAGKKQPKREAKSGCLDIAANLLAESGTAMNCRDLVKQMLEKKLWATKGKTPEATLYSAIIREIKTKGSDARFVKIERGRFTASKK